MGRRQTGHRPAPSLSRSAPEGKVYPPQRAPAGSRGIGERESVGGPASPLVDGLIIEAPARADPGMGKVGMFGERHGKADALGLAAC